MTASTARRDLGVAAAVVAWVGLVLVLDQGASRGQQDLLGVATWLVLLGLLRGESRTVRTQVGVVVAFATVIELVFSGWLGVYDYRLGNVPQFVFPGHGLVYLGALALGRSTWARRHARPFVAAAVGFTGAWALWGLLLADRQDVLGAFWFVCLLGFFRFGRNPLLYASAVVVVSYLELLGTGLGTWTWDLHSPTGLVSMGNPPSGIAGGYGWFDTAALAATPWLEKRFARRGTRAAVAASEP
jgi:hypothetical protein